MMTWQARPRKISQVWTRFSENRGDAPPRGTLIWTPHAQYYVDNAGGETQGSSWFRRVAVPAVLKAVLTAAALGLLYVLIAALAPAPPLPSGTECPQDICGGF